MSRNANRMQEATDRLMTHMQAVASTTINFSRGTTVIRNIKATVGRTPFNVMQGEVMISYESRDYLIQKSDLVYVGLQFEPESGDVITEADGRSYEVSAPKPFNVYESIGPSGFVFKVHTTGPK